MFLRFLGEALGFPEGSLAGLLGGMAGTWGSLGVCEDPWAVPWGALGDPGEVPRGLWGLPEDTWCP